MTNAERIKEIEDRAAFETWCALFELPTNRNDAGYTDENVYWAWDAWQAATSTLRAVEADNARLQAAAFETCANKARQFASHYQEASDGRNTFILLAEWCDAQAQDPRP